jgi:hypothetical protein
MRIAIMTSLAAVGMIVGLTAGPALRAGDLTVTASYSGKGNVDATHEIWVFLFDTPNVNSGSQPVATQALTKNGGVATFKNVAQDTVYILMAYDDKGTYDGNAGPPPAGTPVGMYTKDGKVPAPVKPGPGAKIKTAFDDSRRMGGQ